MSWANRHLPRKRDVSQIPEAFRPVIRPRAEQPQVLLSETFQVKPITTVSSVSAEPLHSTPAFLRRLEPAPHPSATELIHEGQTYVFVILRHLRTSMDNELWISSYQSIRTWYTNRIIIIDDNSSVNTVNGKLVNTEIIISEWNGAGELLPYYYFWKHHWADRMVFLHDSMFLHRPFRASELEGEIRFHWYFDRTTKEDSKLLTYLSLLEQDTVPLASSWKGCFGGGSIVDWKVVVHLEQTYRLLSRMVMVIRTRSDREMFERLLGLLLFHEHIVEEATCSNFGNILSYPGAFESQVGTIEQATQAVLQKGYDTAIVKVWRGR